MIGKATIRATFILFALPLAASGKRRSSGEWRRSSTRSIRPKLRRIIEIFPARTGSTKQL